MVGKYPPAKPGALDMGPLKAAGPELKLHLSVQYTKYFLRMPPKQPFGLFCDLEKTTPWYLHPHFGRYCFKLCIVKLPFVCVVAHDLKFRRWATAVNVKRLLPPRQSRGVSRLC